MAACQLTRMSCCAGPLNLQPLRVSVAVAPVGNVPGISAGGQVITPHLQGQTQASAPGNSSGNISISDLVLDAAPGDYLLTVALLDNPQACSCALCVPSQKMPQQNNATAPACTSH